MQEKYQILSQPLIFYIHSFVNKTKAVQMENLSRELAKKKQKLRLNITFNNGIAVQLSPSPLSNCHMTTTKIARIFDVTFFQTFLRKFPDPNSTLIFHLGLYHRILY